MSDPSPLYTCVINNDLKGVEKLILQNKCSIDERDDLQQTYLHICVLNDKIDILDWFLTARTNRFFKNSLDINAVDLNGNTALHLAIENLNINSAILLLKNGSSPFLPNANKLTPLFILFKNVEKITDDNINDIINIISLLIEKGITFVTVDNNNDTFLHFLIKSDLEFKYFEKIINLIIQKQVDGNIFEITNSNGKSVFEEFISKNYISSFLDSILEYYSPSIEICKKIIPLLNDDCKSKIQDILDDKEGSNFVILPEKKTNITSSPPTSSLNNQIKFSEPVIERNYPGLITRCRLLKCKYPDDHVEVKILALMLDSTFTTKLNIHMKVKQAINKLREHDSLSRMQTNEINLFLPARNSSNSELDSVPVWLDPNLYLWQYGINNGDLISLKRDDKETSQYFWLQIMIQPNNMHLIKKIIRVKKGIIVSDLNQLLHKYFSRLANQFMVLYLHDEYHSGNWMNKEKETIEYYNIRNMDIIELKEKSVFKIAFIDGSEPSNISCSGNTKISNFIKTIICCIANPVDDPTSVGLCCIKKNNKILSVDEYIWLNLNDNFEIYDFKVGDEINCMSCFGEYNNGNVIARLMIESDPQSNLPFIPKKNIKYGEDIPLLSGEVVLTFQTNIRYLGIGQFPQDGILFITNARVIFGKQRKGYLDFSVIINLGCIARIDKQNPSGGHTFLDIFCKDMRTIRFAFLDSNTANQSRTEIYDYLLKLSFPNFQDIFAFYYTDKLLLENKNNNNNIFSYDIEKEFFEIMKVPNSLWRISTINEDYSYSSSYPGKFIIPKCLDDEFLKNVFPFRSKGRISILTYYHHNSATITRCSQPKVGLTNARNESDELLTKEIRLANKKNSNILYIFDARPKANALANQALGMGYEKVSDTTGGYKNCKLEFLNIDNIHVMRDSYYKLQRLCETSHKDDKNFYSNLDNTNWLGIIKLLLSCSAKIAKIIDREGCSVLLHCSDGWDRTAQLSSIAQIFLNPYYRTIKGFQILIEKDWLTVGHKFSFRHGHVDPNFSNEQRSPIFLQFIDCVYQLTTQFPCLFEFNEKYLITIMDNVYSCHFGTFLMNNERERKQANINNITLSLWNFILNYKHEYLNPFYLPGMGVIYPSLYYEDLKLWKGYYLRYCRTPNPYSGITTELRALQLIAMNESLKEQLNK